MSASKAELEKLEQAITDSRVWEMDPESSAYEREKNHLIELCCQYKLEQNDNNAEFGLEIAETAMMCIKAYKPENGSFLFYFNSAFAQNRKRAAAKQAMNDRNSGIHETESQRELHRMVKNFLDKHPDVSPNELILLLEEYAEDFGTTPQKLKEILILLGTSIVSIDKQLDDSDSESDTVGSVIASGYNLEEEVLGKDNVDIERLLDVCEEVYERQREGSKDLLSIKLTNMFAAYIEDSDNEEIVTDREFFRQDIYNVIKMTGRPLENNEIARITGKSASNVTMIWGRFQAQLKAEYEK